MKETDKAKTLCTPSGRAVSCAAIMIAWHAAHPGQPWPFTKSFAEGAGEIQGKFPYSWGRVFDLAEQAKNAPSRNWSSAGDAIRAQLIESGVWHACEFESTGNRDSDEESKRRGGEW